MCTRCSGVKLQLVRLLQGPAAWLLPAPAVGLHIQRRTPEAQPLYQVMSQHLETFLTRTRSSDRQLPSHVERGLRAYLECGILAYGFMRVRCDDCGQSRAVAFSCKRRGFCPGCLGRRMADSAARLTERGHPVRSGASVGVETTL